jgi:flavodoxin
MSRILVVYFSRTGYTRQIAEAIAHELGADVEWVQESKSRQGILGYLRSAREALQQRTVAIRAPGKNPSNYDLVILGTPVWASNMSSPIRAYIVAHRSALGQVALFCTQGGSGAMKALGKMTELCGHKPVATVILNDDEIVKDRYRDKLNGFLRAITLPRAA